MFNYKNLIVFMCIFFINICFSQGNAFSFQSQKSQFNLLGFGNVDYIDSSESNSSFGQASFSPIFNYLYDDFVLMQAEIEFNNANNETEVEVG